MEKKKVFITGMSGYLGGRLCRELDRTDWCEKFSGVDVKKPLAKYDRGEFQKLDINDPELAERVKAFAPDIFIHLAFIVDPIPDENLMHHVNVDGTRNALRAAGSAKVPQVLVASSGTAYGAWPDNPKPIKESDPIRPHPSFRYATDKAELEFLCRDFERDHPETILSIIRPCVVYGPLVNNYLSDLITASPIVTGLRGANPELQFIHEDDVVGAILLILAQKAKGPFNLAPPDTITMQEVIKLSGKPSLSLPEKIMLPLLRLNWALQIPFMKVPPSFIDFIRYEWVLDSRRLREELGYTFRYSTRETVEIMLRAKRVIP